MFSTASPADTPSSRMRYGLGGRPTRRSFCRWLIHRLKAQVDFGFAGVLVRGQQVKVALLVMTLPYSDAIYIQAFPRECTESFLEGHKRAFAFFGGVPKRISYDNAKVAVAKITGARDREVTREFQRLKSHYLFEDHFCLVQRAPWRRATWSGCWTSLSLTISFPVPRVDSLAEFNTELELHCREDLRRQLRGKPDVKEKLLGEERASMLTMPAQEFDARRVTQQPPTLCHWFVSITTRTRCRSSTVIARSPL